jgi:hypothetical protein
MCASVRAMATPPQQHAEYHRNAGYQPYTRLEYVQPKSLDDDVTPPAPPAKAGTSGAPSSSKSPDDVPPPALPAEAGTSAASSSSKSLCDVTPPAMLANAGTSVATSFLKGRQKCAAHLADESLEQDAAPPTSSAKAGTSAAPSSSEGSDDAPPPALPEKAGTSVATSSPERHQSENGTAHFECAQWKCDAHLSDVEGLDDYPSSDESSVSNAHEMMCLDLLHAYQIAQRIGDMPEAMRLRAYADSLGDQELLEDLRGIDVEEKKRAITVSEIRAEFRLYLDVEGSPNDYSSPGESSGSSARVKICRCFVNSYSIALKNGDFERTARIRAHVKSIGDQEILMFFDGIEIEEQEIANQCKRAIEVQSLVDGARTECATDMKKKQTAKIDAGPTADAGLLPSSVPPPQISAKAVSGEVRTLVLQTQIDEEQGMNVVLPMSIVPSPRYFAPAGGDEVLNVFPQLPTPSPSPPKSAKAVGGEGQNISFQLRMPASPSTPNSAKNEGGEGPSISFQPQTSTPPSPPNSAKAEGDEGRNISFQLQRPELAPRE